MPDTRSLLKIAMDDLESARCVCGAKKMPRMSFCRSCYFALPPKFRTDLYKPVSEGYAEVYDESKDWLRINTERLRGTNAR